MPTVAQITDAVARHAGLPPSRVRSVSRKLQDAGVLPRSHGGRVPPLTDVRGVAALIVALLTDAPLHSVADATHRYLAFRIVDEDRVIVARDVLANILTSLATIDMSRSSDAQSFAMSTSVSVVSGDRPAIVFHVANVDGDPVELQFTEHGFPFKAESAATFSRSLTIGAFGLYRIVCGLNLRGAK